MRTERIIWGLIFLFVGGVLLLDNFGAINFQWGSIWRFWPLALIVIGANMLFSRDDSGRSGAIAVILTIAALVFIGYQGSRPDYKAQRWFDNRGGDWESDANMENISYTEEVLPGTAKANLKISGGATHYELKDTTSQLFQVNVTKTFGTYSVRRTRADSIDVLHFTMNGKKGLNFDEMSGNKAYMKLNPRMPWDIDVEVGAGKIDFDLSGFDLRSLNFKGGAASLDVKLGMPKGGTTQVNVQTGVSEIDISVPESAACQIRVESGLSSKDFDGFIKQDDGTYSTANFNSASNKIVINLKGGMSQFKVNRY